jgi:hypothetical protein
MLLEACSEILGMIAKRYMIVDTAANRIASKIIIFIALEYSFKFHVAEKEMSTALINSKAATFLSAT